MGTYGLGVGYGCGDGLDVEKILFVGGYERRHCHQDSRYFHGLLCASASDNDNAWYR